MSRYGIHPMEEHYQNWENERREKRDRYWRMLYNARADYMNLMNEAQAEYDTDAGAFYYYLQQNYGLKMELIDGKITSNYTIVDEKKYSMFLLKYA